MQKLIFRGFSYLKNDRRYKAFARKFRPLSLWAIVSTQFFLELVFVVLGNFDKMGGMIFPSTFPTNG